MKKSIFISAMLCPFLILGELHAQNDATDDDWENGTVGTTGHIVTEAGFTGNVGVGVSDPDSKLEVNGDIKLSSLTNTYRAGNYTILKHNNGNFHGGVWAGGTGSYNIYVGELAGYYNDDNNGVYLGYQAGRGGGDRLIAIGRNAAMGGGEKSICIGASAAETTGGVENVYIGMHAALSAVYTNTNCITLGAYSDLSTGLTNATAIGANSLVTQSNSLVLGAVGPTGTDIGIGVTAPEGRLHVKTEGKDIIFEGLNSTPPMSYDYVVVDGDGVLYGADGPSGITNSCTSSGYLPKADGSGDLSCSQIQDDGSTVGIGGIQNTYMSNPLILYVNGNSLTTGSAYVTSDQRYKKNLSSLDNSLDKLKQLKGVTYEFRSEEFPGINFSDRASIGVIAQDVEKVYPELVITSDEGYKAVNYNGLVPVLIEAVKELEALNKTLEQRVKELETGEGNSVPAGLSGNKIKTSNFLYQNNPNPFTDQTTITYTLADHVRQAKLLIFNMQGTQLSSYELNDRGRGNLVLNGGDLQAGMYLYSLIADGEEVDTKRMILTK